MGNPIPVMRYNADTVSAIRLGVIVDLLSSTRIPDEVKAECESALASLRIAEGRMRDRVTSAGVPQ